MEKAMDREQNTLINELTQGRELANQLKNHLHIAKSPETCEFLLQKIFSSYDKALSMLNWSEVVGEPLSVIGILESSPDFFAGNSPRSESSDRDHNDECRINFLKKRKTLPRWTQNVQVCSETGMEGTLDDGHSWRKYGQKDILGANFPRAYYRCTHRKSQGCLATKQVQKSDNDPSIFEVTYRGRHTCRQAFQTTPPELVSIGKEVSKQEPKEVEKIQKQTQEQVFNFGTSLRVETENLGSMEEIFPSFSFPSTSIETENVECNFFFLESMKENNFMDSCSGSPAFVSPATSDSDYFSLSSCQMNNFGMCHNLQSLDSDLNEIVSTPPSVTNSPIWDLDFSLDPNFSLDTSEFFL